MKKIIIIILTALFALNVQAQTLRTSYFMDKYSNRHQRNPAMSPAWGYIHLPGLGSQINLNILQSNMKLSDYLYPVGKNGSLATFLHPDVSSKEFLRNIGRGGETIGTDGNLGVLGFGFYTKQDRFWSFDLKVRANGGIAVPKDFFALLKDMEVGLGKTYNLKNFNAAGRAYVEMAFGHARDINENIRVGAKLKPLIGIADVRLRVDDAALYSDQDIIRLNVRASGSALGNFIQIEDSAGIVKEITTPENLAVQDLFGGYGAAIDLGVTWNLDNILGSLLPGLPLNGFTASFGLTDFGFIRYKNAAKAEFNKSFVYDGFYVNVDDNEFEFNADHITEQFEDLLENFRKVPSDKGVSRGLRTTTNVGLEYSFLDNKMSAGLLWSTHFGLPKVFNELTFSYNLRPCNWFALSLSSSVANGFFRSAGWAMNITPKYGLTFFIGMDYIPFAWTPKLDDFDWGTRLGVPIHNTNFNLNFGMSIPLGGNRYHKFPSRRELRNRTMEVDTSTSEVEES